MASVRDQILDDAVTRLKTNPGWTADGRVVKNRKLPAKVSQDNYVNVTWTEDAADYSRGQMSNTPERRLSLIVEAANIDAGVGDISDSGDTAAVLVEEKLYEDQTFGGLATGMEIVSYSQEIDQSANEPAINVRLEFIVFYYAAEGAPETVIT